MGGCSSKTDSKASAPVTVQGNGNQTLLTTGAGGDRKEAVDAMVAAVRQAQEPHHVDTSITMCPVFKIEPKNLQLWKAQCDTFYEAAKKEDGMLSYGFAYSEAEGNGEVHIRQCYRDADSLLAHLRAVDVPLQAALKLSQLQRVEVHGLASGLAQVREELTKIGDTYVQFFETEPTAMRRPTTCSGEHGSDTVIFVSHRYKVDANGTGLVKSHAAALAAHAASSPGVDHHALSASDDGCIQLQHGYADAEAAIKHLQDSQEHRVARLERHATLESLEIHGPPTEIERIKTFMAVAAVAVQGAMQAAGTAAAEGAAKVEQSAEAALASVRRATLYVLDGRAIRRAFSSTVAKIEDNLMATEQCVEEAGAAAGAVVGGAVSSAERTVVADVQAVGAATSHAAQVAEANAAAAASAIGDAAVSAEHAAEEDVRAAGAAVSNAAHAAEAQVEAAAAAVGSAAAATAAAVGSAVSSAEQAAADAAAAVGSAIAGAAHGVAEDVRSLEAGAAASASATAAAVGAGFASAVTTVEEAVHPHHIDTTVTMCPYFKIQASNLQLWKAQCDSFYERAKKEDGMLFYGFCFEEMEGDCEVHVRAGFRDAASLLAHLREIDVPIQAALKLSQLERVEVHGPGAELKNVEAEATALGEAKFQFFEAEPEPVRRTSPHAGEHGSDTVVSLCHYYDAADADAQVQIQASAAKLRGEALGTPGLEHHGFAVDGAAGRAHLGQGFRSADEAIASLARDATIHRELAQINSTAVRLEVHGPAAELVKIRAFIVQEDSADQGAASAAVQLRGARIFTLDERALRRAYASGQPVDTLDMGLPTGQPVAIIVDVDARPARCGGWGFFGMCAGC